MKSMRLPAAVLTSTALALAVLPTVGAGAPTRGRVAPRPGLTYGGRTSQGRGAWFRLRADRHAIVSLHLDWTASRSQCTNGQPMEMPEDLGVENGFPPIKIRDGRFGMTVSEDASGFDGVGPERFTFAGTVTDTTIRGTFSGRVRTNRFTGGHYDCTLPRASFSAVD